MTQYDFRLNSGDKNIGTVYLAENIDKPLPVLIYCHGWSGNRSLGIAASELMHRMISSGMAFVTFDFFGCGETGGDYADMTYTRWKNNLSDIIDWVSKQSFTDSSKIGCYGFSSGSTAVLRLAAEDKRISYVISVGTCISAHIAMGGGGPGKLLADNIQELSAGGKVKMFGIDFGLDFYLDTIKLAPVQTMDFITCPVLFLQGLEDNPFRISDTYLGYLMMRKSGHPVEHIEIDGASHSLDNKPEEAATICMRWISERGVFKNE
jgi:uncharacterized protein